MKFLALCLSIAITSTAAFAFDAASVPELKRTKVGQYLSAQEAASFLAKEGPKSLFLDIRTPAEVMFVGMPAMADANVPYMIEPDFPTWDEAKGTLKLESNADFISEVRRRLNAKGLSAGSAIVLICRSGDRSAAAANLLAEAGLKNVYSVVDGFKAISQRTGRRPVSAPSTVGRTRAYRGRTASTRKRCIRSTNSRLTAASGLQHQFPRCSIARQRAFHFNVAR
jgi:rhodanese-related sulfurtransferase